MNLLKNGKTIDPWLRTRLSEINRLLIEMLAFHIGKSDAEKKSNELKLAFIRELRDSLNGSSFAQ